MTEEKYRERIIEILLQKAYARKEGSSRRPSIDPEKLFSGYRKNNASIEEKERLERAASALEERGVISIHRRKFNRDIEIMYLDLDNIGEMERLAKAFGITTRKEASDVIEMMTKKYEGICPQIDHRLEVLRSKARKSPQSTDFEREELILKGAAFLVTNERELYEREASMLIYGTSKVLEGKVNQILTLLGSDDVESYHLQKTDSLIHIKGDVVITIGGKDIDVSVFSQGIGISPEDVDMIERIHVNSTMLMTIENKTSFLRYVQEDTATVFLSGFASRKQIMFLKRILHDNPEIKMLHFGDIDVGGFLILDNLQNALGVCIRPVFMGIEELSDPRYKDCLQNLENTDLQRISALSEEHRLVSNYMKENGVKLEQEIISLLKCCT